MMALKAIASDVFVSMRAPGNWFCTVRGCEVGNGRTLSTPTSRSASPEEAVNDAWFGYTALKPDEYVVLNAMTDQRRCVILNGFMWADIPNQASA